MIERTGWLLDLYEDPLGGLALWFLDDDGARRRLRQRFPVTFYASGPARALAGAGSLAGQASRLTAAAGPAPGCLCREGGARAGR